MFPGNRGDRCAVPYRATQCHETPDIISIKECGLCQLINLFLLCYTGYTSRNLPYFGKKFVRLIYINITNITRRYEHILRQRENPKENFEHKTKRKIG
jgi:hypothetical protein